jgi:hypothetical protein
MSDRLAEISRRQMANAGQPPARANEREKGQATQPETNGATSGKSTRRVFTEGEKDDLVARFLGAEHKKAFAKEAGVSQGALYKWAAGKDRKGSEKPALASRSPAKADLVGLRPAKADLAGLIAAIDTVRTALATLPGAVALDLLEHLRKHLAKESLP